MANDFLDSLGISITADTEKSVRAITELIHSLERLDRKTQQGKDFGFKALAAQINAFAESIKDAIPAMESYSRMLEEIRLASGKSTGSVSRGTRRAATDTKSSAATMEKSLSDVGDSIQILGKEAVDMGQRLKEALAANGGKNPLLEAMTSSVMKTKRSVWMQKNLAPPWERMSTPSKTMGDYLKDIVGFASKTGASFSSAIEAFRSGSASLKEAKDSAEGLSQALVPVRREEHQMVVVQNEYQQQVIRSAEFWKRVGDRIRSALGDSETRTKRLAKALEVAHGVLKKIEIAIRSIIKWAAKTAWNIVKALPGIIAKIGKFAASAMRSIFAGVKKIATPIAKFMGAGAKNLINSVKKIVELSKGLLRRIGRISLYRIVREVLAKAFENIYEGFENLYYWSEVVGYKFKEAMDSIASSSLLVRNAFATMVEPLVTSVYPIVERLAARFAEIAAIVAKFLAELLGRDSYVVARSFAATYKDSLDDVASGANGAAAAVDKYKNTLMGFDELNPLNAVNEHNPSGGSGGGGNGYSASDYAQMFEELPTDLSSWASQIGELIRNAEWGRLGVEIGAKINDIVENQIQWKEIGQKVGNFINAIFTTEYWTLEVTNFENIGSGIAELVSNAIENINWNIVGRTMASKMQALADTIYGFFRDLDWSEVGTSIHDFFVGYAMQWTEWFNGKEWEEVKATFKTNIKNFFDGLNMSDIASSFETLGSAIFNAIKTGFPNAATWVETNIISPIKSAIDGETTWGDAGASIVKSIKKGFPVWKDWVVTNIINPIGAALSGDENWKLDEWLADLKTNAKDVGKQIGDAIAGGIREFFKDHPIRSLIWGESSDYAGQTVNLGGITFTIPQGNTEPIPGVTYSQGDGNGKAPATGDSDSFWNSLAGKTIDVSAKFTDWWTGFKTDPWSWAKWSWANGGNSGELPVLVGGGTGIAVPVTASVTSVQDKIPLKSKVIKKMKSVFSSNGVSSEYSHDVDGMVSVFSAKSFAASYEKRVDGMRTEFSSKGFAATYDTTVHDMHSELKDRYFTSSFSKTVPEMTGELSKRTFTSGFSKTVSGMTGELTSAKDNVPASQKTLQNFVASIIKKSNDLKADKNGVYGWLDYGADLVKKYVDMSKDSSGVFGWLAYGSDLIKKYVDMSKDSSGVYGWLGYGSNLITKYVGMSKDSYGAYGWLNYGANIASKYVDLPLWSSTYKVYGWLNYGADIVSKYNSLSKDGYGVYGWMNFGASIVKLWNSITSMWITKADGGIFYGGAWHDVASYAQGGSPLSGQMFIAREAGPELVGTLGGHTAVMNNDQIVASVSAGVARAISNIQFHMTGFPTYGGIDEETLYRAFFRALNDADIGGDTYLDGDVLYRKMRDRNIMNTRMTGVNAFA